MLGAGQFCARAVEARRSVLKSWRRVGILLIVYQSFAGRKAESCFLVHQFTQMIASMLSSDRRCGPSSIPM
jgi:hypothetical protein